MNLLQDIFKILHQPVQLLIAALMFAYKEPKRKFWLIRAVLAAILEFLVLKLCITVSPEILLNSFLTSLVYGNRPICNNICTGIGMYFVMHYIGI